MTEPYLHSRRADHYQHDIVVTAKIGIRYLKYKFILCNQFGFVDSSMRAFEFSLFRIVFLLHFHSNDVIGVRFVVILNLESHLHFAYPRNRSRTAAVDICRFD